AKCSCLLQNPGWISQAKSCPCVMVIAAATQQMRAAEIMRLFSRHGGGEGSFCLALAGVGVHLSSNNWSSLKRSGGY
ncbi:hypothetical protein Anapl_10302, partial [Anas platyrhynchos]